MKYKNYRNPHTNDSRIYSFNDLCNMLFGDVVKRKKEILGQYKTIGVPTEQDLQSSENVVYVETYTRDDGTEVKAHYRSKPGCGSLDAKSNETDNQQYQVPKSEDAEIKYIKPVEGKVTSSFGYRDTPIAGASNNHSGIDIGVPVGTPVKAIADGTVTAANGGMRGYGNGVFIDHGIINGKRVVSEYGHLSSFDVKVGDKIKQGQVIAKSGNTGISNGPHLHLTIREDNKPVNPKNYVGEF